MRVMKSLGVAALLLVVVFGMQSCGKKTRLKNPEGATYPRQYPAP